MAFLTWLSGVLSFLSPSRAVLAHYKTTIERLEKEIASIREELEHCEKRSSEYLEELSSLKEAILDNLTGSIVADDKGIIIQWSPGATLIFKWSEQQIVGKPVNTIVPYSMRDMHKVVYATAVTSNKPIAQGWRNLHGLTKTGEVIPIRIRLSRFAVAEGVFNFAAEIKKGHLVSTFN